MISEEIARQVRTIKHSAAFDAAFDQLAADIKEQWAASELTDTQSRDIFYFQLRGLTMLRQTLANWARETESRTGA